MVRGLSKCAAVDLAKSGIRVNAILPGLIDTPMLGENTAEHLQQMARMVPMGRFGTVDEVANVVAFVCSQQGSLVTGACIPVDGAQGRSNS